MPAALDNTMLSEGVANQLEALKGLGGESYVNEEALLNHLDEYTRNHLPAGPLCQQFGHGGNKDAIEYFAARTELIRESFPEAMGCEDFLTRTEIALDKFGFNGDNSIAMTNLCRDEITSIFRSKIEDIFGMNFSTNGLGGVMTCGKTGIKAGISHAPICSHTGKVSYVFFAFPHIAIDAHGTVGEIGRPGRDMPSHACGALIGALNEIQKHAYDRKEHPPGQHDSDDPEMSILIHRLSRMLKIKEDHEALDPECLDLVEITKVAEEVIRRDLERLISQVVNTQEADYAVVTGIQVHSWGSQYNDPHPNLEFVQPGKCYTVVNGERTDVDILALAGPTPRQLRLLNAPSLQRKALDHQIRPQAPNMMRKQPSPGSSNRCLTPSGSFKGLLSPGGSFKGVSTKSPGGSARGLSSHFVDADRGLSSHFVDADEGERLEDAELVEDAGESSRGLRR